MLPLEKMFLKARAVRCGFGEADSGNRQVFVECEVVEHDEFNGETITWVGTFSDRASARTIESLQFMGWTGDDLSALDGLGRDECATILPDVVDLDCAPEEYDGKWRLKANWVNKPGGGRFAFKKPLAGAELKAFAAQMKATVQSVRGAGAKAATPSRPANGGGGYRPSEPHPNAPGGGRDDIPF